MKRRTIVFAIAGLAVAAFAAAVFSYNGLGANRSATPVQATAVIAQPSVPIVVSGAAQHGATIPGPDGAKAAVADTGPPATKGPTTPPKWNALVRAHSPVLGPVDARVTIVEFFDPACEACRAFYPIVKQTMAEYPRDVRVVLRYAPFHQGSDEVVRILEAARLQNLFEPVLEALLARQPEWASHSGFQLDNAWAAADAAGLDVAKAREAMLAPHITAALTQDMEDLTAVGVARTPTFFVNG